MKAAIIGSRSLNIDISKYIPEGVTSIISGGAGGIDSLAEKYARENNIEIEIIRPQYQRYGRCAPIIRNREIVDKADLVVAIWDGKSKGTKSVLSYADKAGKEVILYIAGSENEE